MHRFKGLESAIVTETPIQPTYLRYSFILFCLIMKHSILLILTLTYIQFHEHLKTNNEFLTMLLTTDHFSVFSIFESWSLIQKVKLLHVIGKIHECFWGFWYLSFKICRISTCTGLQWAVWVFLFVDQLIHCLMQYFICIFVIIAQAT